MTGPVLTLLNADALTDAAAAAAAQVKARPQEAEARMLLAQIAVLQDDLKRAETHATMAARLSPDDALGYGVFRQHLRGLLARQAWWDQGAVPGFPGGPSPCDQAAVALNITLRDGGDAAAALAALEQLRGAVPGGWNGQMVDDLRDLDDRLPHAVEAISAGGNYLWLDMARIARITFRPVATPLDLALRPARVELIDGAEADLVLPAIYPAPEGDAHRLGRQTDFTETSGLTIGHGQKAWLAGDDMRGFLSADILTFGADHG